MRFFEHRFSTGGGAPWFIFEGRFRQKIVRKGRNRDSDWLSMIDGEWPRCDAVLQRWLAAENFDEHGRQRRSMADFVTKSLHTE